MRDHRHAIDAEEEGSAELAPIGAAPDRPQLGTDERPTQRCKGVALDGVTDALEDELGGALGGLDQDVAAETVRDDDIGLTLEDVLAFDVADEIDRLESAQQGLACLHQLVALAGLFAIAEQCHPWRLETHELFGVDAPHQGVLDQVLGLGVGVGADVPMRLDAAGHYLVGSKITTHRIERDFHGETGLQRLNVQVAHGLGVRLDESFAGIDVGTHQDVEDLVRLDRVFDLDAEQHPVLWVHGRFPQLVGVHLAETFVAGDLRLSRHLGQLPILLLFGVGVTDLFPASDLVERRLCDVQIFAGDHLRHVAEEKCQEQCADVRTIYVSIGHYQYMVISEFTDIKLLADTSPERGDQVTDLLGGEDLVFAGLLDVEDLAAQRQDRLDAAATSTFRGTTGGIALHQVDLAQARVAFGAIGQLPG